MDGSNILLCLTVGVAIWALVEVIFKDFMFKPRDLRPDPKLQRNMVRLLKQRGLIK